MTRTTPADEEIANATDSAVTALKDRATEALGKGVETAQETATQASEQAKVAADRANEEMRKLADTSTQFVRDNPGAAVAGALGVGVLLGLALRAHR